MCCGHDVYETGRFTADYPKPRPVGAVAPVANCWAPNQLLLNFRLNKFREQNKGLLPAEIAHFTRDHVGNSYLHDAQLGSAGNRLQRNRNLDYARKIRVVKRVGVALAVTPNC